MDKILKTLKIDKELDDLIEDYCKLTKNIFGNKPTFTHIVTSGIATYLLEQIDVIKIISSGNCVILSDIGEKTTLTISDKDKETLANLENALMCRKYANDENIIIE